ncbi:hypothetical protein [Solibacillus sp. CAU 1738]|uniref:hypothetical protein n=1 Tax=Solibacillus sp. CAU 1738 TaxID=3140363 RepID=UPI00326150C2
MTNIINFLQKKHEHDEQRIEKLFQKANSHSEKLDLLIQQKELAVHDHQLFLAFLTYLEQQQINAQQLFKDVINLPKFQFEAQYCMNWTQVVKLSVTFLTILKHNDPESYEHFIG